MGSRWTEPGKLSSMGKGKLGSPHLGSGLSRKCGESLMQCLLQGQPSQGAPRAVGGCHCPRASPSVRRVGDSCGIWGVVRKPHDPDSCHCRE